MFEVIFNEEMMVFPNTLTCVGDLFPLKVETSPAAAERSPTFSSSRRERECFRRRPSMRRSLSFVNLKSLITAEELPTRLTWSALSKQNHPVCSEATPSHGTLRSSAGGRVSAAAALRRTFKSSL